MKKLNFKKIVISILSVLLVISMSVTFAGCSKNTPKAVVDRYFDAMFVSFDTQEFIDVMSPLRFEADMKRSGVSEDKYEDSVDVLIYGVKQQLKNGGITVKWSISDVNELDEHTFGHLKEHYSKEYDYNLKDAKLVRAEATQTSADKTESTTFEFVVVKIDGKWYVDTVDNKQS